MGQVPLIGYGKGRIGILVNGAVAIAGSVIAKDVARLNRVMDKMRARLAEIEVEIKSLLHQIEEKRIMDTLNRAAESYSQILKAASMF